MILIDYLIMLNIVMLVLLLQMIASSSSTTILHIISKAAYLPSEGVSSDEGMAYYLSNVKDRFFFCWPSLRHVATKHEKRELRG